MKTIKNLTLFMGLCAAVLLAAGCKDKEEEFPCSLPTPPHPPLAIDWEGYNDAYDVYWNYTLDCTQPPFEYEGEGKIIKITGWLVQAWIDAAEIGSISHFFLTDKSDQKDFEHLMHTILVVVAVDYSVPELKEQLKEQFENSDLTAKCYITGALSIDHLYTYCCVTAPIITLTSIDDIIFE